MARREGSRGRTERKILFSPSSTVAESIDKSTSTILSFWLSRLPTAKFNLSHLFWCLQLYLFRLCLVSCITSLACLAVLVSFSDEGEWQARQFFALVYAPLLQTRILQRNPLTNQDHSNGRPINQSNFRWILARPTLLAATFIRQIHLDVRSGPNMCMHTDCRC